MWRDIIAINWIVGLLIMFSAMWTDQFRDVIHAERIRQGRGEASFFVIMYISGLMASLIWEAMLVAPFVKFLKGLDR